MQSLGFRTRLAAALLGVMLPDASASAYQQTNLVSDLPGVAAHQDANLKNPWGISYAPTGPFWVSDNGTGLATLYNASGGAIPLVVTIPPAGQQPAPSAPTGQVFNNTQGFALPGGQPAAFLFATEGGARGSWGKDTFWNASAYRTDLADDIQFISAGTGAVNSGYFQNIGRTRREGIELGAGAPLGPVALTARYSYARATYRTGFVETSPNNTTANADGEITVSPGDSLPGIPRQLLKLRGVLAPAPAVSIGATLVAASSQYARGNENNLDPGGTVPGYAVVNLDARWQVDPEWQVFGNVTNLFHTRYQNFGILGANYFRGPGNTYAPALAGPEPFRAPATPFGVWVGVQWTFGRKGS